MIRWLTDRADGNAQINCTFATLDALQGILQVRPAYVEIASFLAMTRGEGVAWLGLVLCLVLGIPYQADTREEE